MAELLPVLLVITGYVAALFGVAIWVERRASRGGRSLAGGAVVYALSQAVFCTTWTFYGSVGYAATSGLLFLSVYLGPTLAMALWWSVLRKLVRLKNVHRLTSLADFLGARYGKSQAVGALATLMIVVGLVPYVSLQLKTMISTVSTLTGPSESGQVLVGPAIVLLTLVFTLVFGIRKLDPTERHPGMMVALALECVVKLVAFLGVGLFVCFVLYDSPFALFEQAQSHPVAALPLTDSAFVPAPSSWLAHLLVSGAAILLLPRQFHVSVVENSDEKHLLTSMWLVPLYLLAINLFVVPVAVAGLAQGLSPGRADSFVLDLPLAAGNRWVSWLVFFGGFSAGIGMVVTETMTLATMLCNHLVVPVIDRVRGLSFLRRHLLSVRWVGASVVIVAAYAYEETFSGRYELVSIGLTSFAAVAQFAPALLGGLYWRGGNRAGALSGLLMGFGLWGFTLGVPVLIRAGYLPQSLLADGLLGLSLLRPEALFGVEGLDRLTHSVLWSLCLNSVAYVLGSVYFRPSALDVRQAEQFVDALAASSGPEAPSQIPQTIEASAKLRLVESLFRAYHPDSEADQLAKGCFEAAKVSDQGLITVVQLAQVETQVEHALAGYVGSASAHSALKREGLLTPAEAAELSSAYAAMLAELRISPAEVRRKIDYYRERERLVEREAETFRILSDVSRSLAAWIDYETTINSAARLAVPALADGALLYVEERPAAPDLAPVHRFIAVHREREVEHELRTRLEQADLHPGALPRLAAVLQSGQLDLETGGPSGSWPAPFSTLNFRATVTLPLFARRRLLGALTLFVSEDSTFSYPQDLGLAVELAHRCAIALDNALLYRSAQEAVRARDEFMAVASHELKTPLTPLKLQVQTLQRLLARGELGTLPREKLDGLLKSSDGQLSRLASLVDKLLDVSRISTGRLKITPEQLELSPLVQEVVERHQDEVRQSGCTVELEVAAGLQGKWDRLRIEQLVTNLLTNAFKYAPGKKVAIRARKLGERVSLEVQDDGPGIAAVDQERIFQPFERAVSYLNVSGFGLGLYVVRQIADAHGGEVRLECGPGQGCTFVVLLPFEPPESRRVAPEEVRISGDA